MPPPEGCTILFLRFMTVPSRLRPPSGVEWRGSGAIRKLHECQIQRHKKVVEITDQEALSEDRIARSVHWRHHLGCAAVEEEEVLRWETRLERAVPAWP